MSVYGYCALLRRRQELREDVVIVIQLAPVLSGADPGDD